MPAFNYSRIHEVRLLEQEALTQPAQDREELKPLPKAPCFSSNGQRNLRRFTAVFDQDELHIRF